MISIFCSLQLNARTFQISTDGEYKKPSAVVNLVSDGDTVEIQSGEYLEDVASWRKNNLVFHGVNGYAHLNANGKSAESKAIWVIKGNDCKVENIEFSNCRVPDNNGAGIRMEGTNLTLSYCYFHDNQDGILTGANPNSTLIVEYCEFGNNSADDGLSHNMYIGHLKEFYLKYSYIHNARVGHNVKSRAVATYILYNRIMDEKAGNSSYLIDVPNGGLTCIMGNILMKSNLAENPSAISYGFEGTYDTLTNSIFLINNTFLNYKNNGKFAQIKDGIANFESLVINNLIAGTSNFITGKCDTAANLILKNIDDAKLVNPEAYDYHLLENSPARNNGQNPLNFQQNIYGFYPEYEYVHKPFKTVRNVAKTIDIGAYEYPENETSVEDNAFPIIKLFPNPAHNQMSISFNSIETKETKIAILNALGQSILELNPIISTLNTIDIDLSNISNGVYFLKLEAGGNIYFEKFILNH